MRALLALLAAPLGLAPGTAAGVPTLPAAFADFSIDTPAATDSPAGRAIAMFSTLTVVNGGGFGPARTIVVGADSDTYRTVDNPDLDPGYTTYQQAVRLSPDGTHVLSAVRSPEMDEFALLDLTTGASRTVHGLPLPAPGGAWSVSAAIPVTLDAWSPDGRYVAVGYPEFPTLENQLTSESSRAYLLDLQTERWIALPVDHVIGAAFSPDGLRLVVASTLGSTIFDLGDQPTSDVVGTAGPRLGPDMAWSPDGTVIAMDQGLGLGGCQPPTRAAVHFVAMAEDAHVPAPITTTGCLEVLGWRSPTSLLVSQATPDNQRTIVEYSTVDGSGTVLSRLSTGGDCRRSDFLLTIDSESHCDIPRMQLATGLLGSIGIRPGTAQSRWHGPWWTPGQWATAIACTLLFAAAVAWPAVRLIRRRRSPVAAT